MIFEQPLGFRIVQVLDRGVPNREAIALFAYEGVNLAQYGIVLGYMPDPSTGITMPYRDHFFWFGDGLVSKGDWVYVFTGSGKATKTALKNDPGATAYALHWGKPATIFAHSQVVPLLFRMEAIDIATPPVDQPQLPLIPVS